MCGIMGFNYKPASESAYSVSQHRGPDNTEILTFGDFIFGHHRLSIVDHDINSNQPMESLCGNYLIVFNGEVYNHPELKEQLRSKYEFRTQSDTEVILNAFIEYGPKCLELFRGMFAFSVYNKRDGALFCARDRVGIKPFNYYYSEGKFSFASELSVLLASLENKPTINIPAIKQFIRYLYIPHPDTVYKDIFKLEPGCYLWFKNGELSINKYWDCQTDIQENVPDQEGEILNELDSILNDSVKMRMIADVELGAFLSGGLDSTSILYYMSKNSSKKINTYTLAFKDAELYDESSDANLVAEYFNTNHNEILIDANAVDLLPKMVAHFGEPFSSPTALLIHDLTKETKNFATVALAGDGGDEIFGGYPRYKALGYADTARYLPRPILHFMSKLANNIPEASEGNHLPRRIKTFLNSVSLEDADMYDEWMAYISSKELEDLFVSKADYRKSVKELWKDISCSNSLIKGSMVDIQSFLPCDLLNYGDIMSMANSFEVRFPLLDHKLIEFMSGVDSKWRICNGETKYLLRRLLDGNVPDRVLSKPKLGLNPPMGIWLKKDMKKLIDDYLSREVIQKRDIFDYTYVQKMIDDFFSNRKDWSLNLWSMIVLEEWFRQFID